MHEKRKFRILPIFNKIMITKMTSGEQSNTDTLTIHHHNFIISKLIIYKFFL